MTTKTVLLLVGAAGAVGVGLWWWKRSKGAGGMTVPSLVSLSTVSGQAPAPPGVQSQRTLSPVRLPDGTIMQADPTNPTYIALRAQADEQERKTYGARGF